MDETGGNRMISNYLEDNKQPRKKKTILPSWLEKLSQMPACKACGVIAGGCLYEDVGKECKRED